MLMTVEVARRFALQLHFLKSPPNRALYRFAHTAQQGSLYLFTADIPEAAMYPSAHANQQGSLYPLLH